MTPADPSHAVLRQLVLRFADHSVVSETHVNLSAVRADGDHLWVAGDETASIERLHRTADGYGEQLHIPLPGLIELPGDDDEEVDVEGLSRNGPFLWVAGSHSAKRRRLKPKHHGRAAHDRLAKVRPEPARRVLARLAIEADDDGAPVAVPVTTDGHRSSSLPAPGLFDLLDDDPLLGPFLTIPGKDNGFDIEGIAARGDTGAETVLLGLRGPVVRGWATVLEVAPRETEPGRLELAELPDGSRYRVHLLDLGGLGIRDLAWDGTDLLILAGPTMTLDGALRVHRWSDAVGAIGHDEPTVVHHVPVALDLPTGPGVDNAEGLTMLGPGELLVVYDSPAPDRLIGDGLILADVLALPGTAPP